ncbi:NTP transferase domain-containing protein [Gammaproteobacteria bacterium]|nr:NTP transferase domain-containing protein [Gammaproteobacteria bacterium]
MEAGHLVNVMRIIIYAAGVSRRLQTIAGNGLKGLLELNGKRIIEYQLDWSSKLPVSEIIIVIGLEHELYKEILGDNYNGIPLVYIYNPDYKDKGNMLSLWYAQEFCDKETIFTTSDLVCNQKDIAKFINAKADNKILIDNKNLDLFKDPDPVKVTINNGRILNILKNQNNLARVDGVAVGLYYFSYKGIRCIIDSIDKKIRSGNDNMSLYYAIDDILIDNIVQPVFSDESDWVDIDTPDDLNNARNMLINYNKFNKELL